MVLLLSLNNVCLHLLVNTRFAKNCDLTQCSIHGQYVKRRYSISVNIAKNEGRFLSCFMGVTGGHKHTSLNGFRGRNNVMPGLCVVWGFIRHLRVYMSVHMRRVTRKTVE